MNQGRAWEKEYQDSKLVTKADGPQSDTLRFLKFLKKDQKYKIEGRNILDLGSGTGRNANYLVEEGNSVIGIEISKTALTLAKERANDMGLKVDYRLGDIGEHYEIPDESIDLVLDVTSSNALDEKGRAVYLSEVSRVLKSGGYFFVRALCKDGNRNVKNLLKDSPGREYDTYYMKDLDLYERVFSREDFIKMYGQYFKILSLEKKTSYPTVDGRIYKRDYWLAYLKSKK
jgi:SAM-dependent methyltransferase